MNRTNILYNFNKCVVRDFQNKVLRDVTSLELVHIKGTSEFTYMFKGTDSIEHIGMKFTLKKVN